MRVNAVNNQSFTGFKLKGDGVRVLAEKFVNDPQYEKVFMRRIVLPLKNTKTDVIYDGKDVFVKNVFGKRKINDFVGNDYLNGDKHSVYKVVVKRFGDKKFKQIEDYYIPDSGNGAKKVLKDTEETGIPYEFFAAKQIALYEDDILYSNVKQHLHDKMPLEHDKAIENKIRNLEFLFGKN